MSRACAGRCTCVLALVAVNKDVVLVKRLLAFIHLLHGFELLWQDANNVVHKHKHFKCTWLKCKEWPGIAIFGTVAWNGQQVKSNGITHLFTEASEIAKPAFESAGYTAMKKRTFEIDGVEITNWAMVREIEPAAPKKKRAL